MKSEVIFLESSEKKFMRTDSAIIHTLRPDGSVYF